MLQIFFLRGYLILGGFDCHFLKLFILKYTTFEVLGVAFLSAGVAFLVVGVALDLTGVVGPRPLPGVIAISFEGFETNDFCFEASLKYDKLIELFQELFQKLYPIM